MPPCQGSSILPCMAPMGCGLLVGPPAVPKRPQCGAAWHLPGVLTAHSEPTLKVLCSVLVPFLQAQKRPFSHAQVLLYWFCSSDAAVLWNWAFPLPRQRVWFTSNLAQRFPAPPFLLKPSFCLQHGFRQLLWRPCSCLMPGRARRGILNPERRGTPQPRLGMVVRSQDSSCAI